MRIIGQTGFLCEFSEDETAKLHAIAERYGITIEEALKKAILNFLTKGVQTPKSPSPLDAA